MKALLLCNYDYFSFYARKMLINYIHPVITTEAKIIKQTLNKNNISLA